MHDEEKTKNELIEELNLLRRKKNNCSENRQQQVPCQQAQKRQQRVPIKTRIEFIGDFDIVEAHGVNISEGGICFKIDSDLPFELKYEQEGIVQQQRANLVWVRKSEARGYLLGLKFTDPEPYPEL